MTAHSSLITDYLGYGTHAARPATPNLGSGVTAVYYETDTGNTFAWSGSAWVQLNGTGGTALAYSLFQARLTGSSGVPVTTSDVTAIATLYLTPYLGNQIGLYTSSAWEVATLSEISLSLSGLLVGVLYDIFVYNNSGTLTLEALAWKKVTSASSPTSGSSKTLNLADTATLAVGMNVTIKDGSNSEVASITAVVASTSITVASLSHSYTTPDVYGYQARATALALQDGVYCKTGALSRRYCGTIAITTTAGQTEDSAARRLLWNYYHRKGRKLLRQEATATWTYNVNTWRQANAAAANKVEVVQGLAEDTAEITVAAEMSNSTGPVAAFGNVGIGINSTTVNGSDLQPEIGLNTTTAIRAYAPAHLSHCALGYFYYAWLEVTRVGNITWEGVLTSNSQGGMFGTVQG